MDKMLYLAMSGAQQATLAQKINANNLANISTTGFLADLTQSRAAQVQGSGYPSRTYTVNEKTSVDFTPGNIVTTNRDLDIAINGNGWIAVQAKDGTEAYTRAGNLQVETGGLLVTGAGLPVLGNGGPITIPPAQKLNIGNDGTISIIPLGQEENALAVLDRIKLVSTDNSGLYKGSDGLLRTKSGSELEPNANTTIVSGALESSNVNSVSALINMISLSRQYETQIKLMKSAEELDTSSDQLLRL